MSEIGMKIIINIVIFVGVFVGFILYMKKYTDWFEEGGFFYELRKKLKEKKEKEKNKPIKKQ